LPAVPAVVSVRPTGGDGTALLQGAINRVATMPLRNGFRGAILLRQGRYRLTDSLAIRASGIVLRGAEHTTVVAAGPGRRALIEAGGTAAPSGPQSSAIVDDFVPAGARTFTVAAVTGIRVGDRIVITRPSTAAWISALHMSGLPGTYASQRLDWAPGSRNL